MLNNKKIWLGDVRAYNFEMLWLEQEKMMKFDTADNWGEIILNYWGKINLF